MCDHIYTNTAQTVLHTTAYFYYNCCGTTAVSKYTINTPVTKNLDMILLFTSLALTFGSMSRSDTLDLFGKDLVSVAWVYFFKPRNILTPPSLNFRSWRRT